ncbi:MAG: SMP-30/gluconolactonase/LRE family protein [Bacteroidota bacterium]
MFNPKGEKIGTIEIPETPANVCFAGKDRKMLFVTARTSVYTVPMKVAGAY